MDDFSIQNNLYGFALSGLTSRLLWRLKPLRMCYSVWPNNIEQYLDILLHDQPKYIVGLATYSGGDPNFIKIETLTKNQFRNSVIENELPMSKKLLIKPFVKQIPQTKYASALGNSWCNLVSWKIVKLIEDEKLNSQYTFLHIPDSFKYRETLEVLEEMLSPFQSS